MSATFNLIIGPIFWSPVTAQTPPAELYIPRVKAFDKAEVGRSSNTN